MQKKQILIIQGTISHYNVPLYNVLNQKYDITLMHSDNQCCDKEYTFNTIYNPCEKFRWFIHKKNILRIVKKYDAVICMMDPSYFYFRLLSLFHKKTKLIYWGIGVSASYNCRFDEIQAIVPIIMKWAIRADATVFYTEYAKNKYVKLGIPESKLFVAPNTVDIPRIEPSKQKNDYLFVGSLYKQKKIDVLIEQYYKAYLKNNNIGKLYIIGDGAEKDYLINFINDIYLQDKVILCGQIIDESVLSQYFNKSLLCISPDQAGLTVLKSMGYGVCFVTHKDAITGGERLNIKDKENGFLIDSFDEISKLILDSNKHPEKYIAIGRKAFDKYWDSRTINHMAQGFIDAIEYVTRNDNEKYTG